MRLADELAAVVRDLDISRDPFEALAEYIEANYVPRADATEGPAQG